MAKTDEEKLKDEFMKIWKRLSKILWVAAINSESDIAWEILFPFDKVIASLHRTSKELIAQYEVKLYAYLQPLTNMVEAPTDYRFDLTPDKVKEFERLAKDLEKHLQSFRHLLRVGLEGVEAQEEQKEGKEGEREKKVKKAVDIEKLVKRQAKEEALPPLKDDDPFWDVNDAYLDELQSRVERGLREDDD